MCRLETMVASPPLEEACNAVTSLLHNFVSANRPCLGMLWTCADGPTLQYHYSCRKPTLLWLHHNEQRSVSRTSQLHATPFMAAPATKRSQSAHALPCSGSSVKRPRNVLTENGPATKMAA